MRLLMLALAATTDRLAAGAYNVADDEPLRHRDLLAVLARAAGRAVKPPPSWLPRLIPGPVGSMVGRSNRVRSESFRTATGWRPSVPSRRAGWPAVFDALAADQA